MARRKEDKLAKDVAAAKAAGMSYGKWRAMRWLQGDVEEIKAPVKPKGLKECPWCGTLFKPKRNQQYCDFNCQRAAQEDRMRVRTSGAIH
jgi:hypothetical protein